MPKSRSLGSSVTYHCDICDFKVTNSYIFKRHLHRCYTLHGVASKRSSPRMPLRLKGTEGVRSVGGETGGRLDTVKGEESQSLTCGETGDEKLGNEDDDNNIDGNDDNENAAVMEGVSQGEDNDLLSPSPMSSTQWSVKDSPVPVAGSTRVDNDEEDESRIVSLNGENDDTMDSATTAGAAYVDDDMTDSPNSSIVKAKFERNYACEYCQFKTVKSREFLYHLRDSHCERLKIFECHICDYASRYNNKLIRHMTIHNKIDMSGTAGDDGNAVIGQNVDVAEDTLENLELKVKPLKLKRLHVKTPSVFQVTHESKVKKELQASPPMGKNVFKMVLSADGSHDYQCRDCLFYASSAIAVKRHYTLCHSKLLQCLHCDFNTRSQAEYYEHIITHDGRITYHKCPDCSYVTHAKPTFENHRSHHGSDAPFKCRVCNFAADSESKVKRHMATQHTNKNDDTDLMGEAASHQLGVSGAAASGWLEGDIEGQEFVDDRSAMVMDIDGDGSKNYLEVMEPTIGKSRKQLLKFKCPHCLVVCLRRANLTRHLVARHDYSQQKASFSSKSLEKQMLKRKPSQQSVASSLVASASKLIKQQTAAVSQDDLQCSECSYLAKWPSDLRRHQQVHTMVKRFKCPICTSKYKYLGDLNVHMRRDHLMEPQQHTIAEDVISSEVVKKSSPAMFRCPICAFATGTKADLEQHTRQHGDIEKTFQCRLCDYQTYWRGDVGRHLFRHHKIHLSKDGVELEKHFIFRSGIRPLTKMPMSFKIEHNIDDGQIDEKNAIVNTPNQLPSEKASFKTVLMNANQSSGGKDSSLVCTYPGCGYRTTTTNKLEIHMAIHENIKIFKCSTCGKRANYKWDVVKHMVKVHKNPSAGTDDVIILPVQEARETISEYLSGCEKKVLDTPTFGCSICDFKSGEKNLVVTHLDEKHPEENGSVISFLNILSNVKQESGDRTEGASNEDYVVQKFVEPSPEELAKHEKPYACGICKKDELTLLDIQRHYNYTHPYKDVRAIYNPDGTEFDCNTLEICPPVNVKKTPNFLEAEECAQQTSPQSGKMIRSDSKYSNPKMHGYVKPFKCSVCGLRSNWKWDLKKHLRSKHAHDGGFVIMLSIEEAQMTYGKECSRSHPKCESQFMNSDISNPIVTPSPSFNDSSSPTDFYASGSSKNKSGQFPSVGTSYDPARRQWKCSGCDYITNWRRNMARHMTRRHKEEKSQMHVIALHMLNKHEQEAILEERKNRMEKYGNLAVDMDEEEYGEDESVNDSWSANASGGNFSKLRAGQGAGSGTDDRLWKCPKCSYHSTLRTHIIIHMQKHELRPFLCGVCNTPFMNRSPLHSHIQKIHRRPDYIKLVKVNIRYDGVIDQSHLGMAQQKQAFQCVLCKTKFVEKSSAVQHIKSSHGVDVNIDDYITAVDNNNAVYSAISSSKLFAINTGNNDSGGIVVDGTIIKRKIHYCRLCPYTTQKKSMLSFHMTYHKPTQTNRLKCKYCPYYVSTTRLLHQHQRKWHLDSKKIDSNTNNATAHPASMLWEYPQSTPPHSPSKRGGNEAGTPRRHACEKCPYTTNCKNDFYYHKQFHRPKRTAEYKCEFCDYWVVHKRLLKQHMRLHEQANMMQELSPVKSVYSDPGLVYDPVELTELAALKQNMISAKILPSLSKSPKISPMKIASRCSVDDKPGYVLKNGLYRKLHKCPKCPYTNTRARNMNLHVMMHGPRESSYPLMRCPYCDYYVGSKGLLSHHMKVHQKQYGDTPENDARRASLGLDDDEGDDSDDMVDIQAEQKVDTLLQISRMKRFGCEKCPYASAKRQHFERHLELHGSRQRYTCQYCDYSVPSSYLLTQHSRLHLMPNQNLLSCQSINNLQHVGEVPADVALASALPPSDSDMSVTISVIHDHLGLYENSIYDPEQKKLYRCDRCPYANIRRDHLLSHLKFHMVSSSLVCPYCDYSAPKQALLTQHIRVHFCPLPELSDWLMENGQIERETSQRNIDMAEALKVAKEYQSQSKKKGNGKEGEKESGNDGVKVEEKENIEDKKASDPDPFICQYCDRDFMSSEKLVKHELQHLIGNQFEMALKMLKTDKSVEAKYRTKTENKDNRNGNCGNTASGDVVSKSGRNKSEPDCKDDVDMKEESRQDEERDKIEDRKLENADKEKKKTENEKDGEVLSEKNVELVITEGNKENKEQNDGDVNIKDDINSCIQTEGAETFNSKDDENVSKNEIVEKEGDDRTEHALKENETDNNMDKQVKEVNVGESMETNDNTENSSDVEMDDKESHTVGEKKTDIVDKQQVCDKDKVGGKDGLEVEDEKEMEELLKSDDDDVKVNDDKDAVEIAGCEKNKLEEIDDNTVEKKGGEK